MHDTEIGAVFNFLGRHYRRMLIAGVCAGLLGVLYAMFAPSYYAATATLVVENRRPRTVSDPPQYIDEPGYVDTQVATIQSDLILRPVVAALRLAEDPEFNGSDRLSARLFGDADVPRDYREEQMAIARLRRSLAASRVGASHVVELTARSRDAEKAARIANAVAMRFVEDQRAFAEKITERANAPTATRIIGQATRPLENAGLGAVMLGAAGFLGGLLLSGVALAAMEAVRPRFSSAGDVANALGRACAGALGAPSRKTAVKAGAQGLFQRRRRPPAARDVPPYAEPETSPFLEGLRRLAFVLEQGAVAQHAIVAGFASAAPSFERPLAAANMAMLFARMGRKTLLIDMAAPPGQPDDAGQAPSPVQNGLDVVAPHRSSATHFNPAAWLRSALSAGAEAYDCVIVDLPPILVSGDAPFLVNLLPTTVLLVTLQSDLQSETLEALRLIEDSSAGRAPLVACMDPAFPKTIF